MISTKHLRNAFIAVALGSALIVPVVGAAGNVISLVGSTTVEPIASGTEDDFEAAFPGYDLTISGGGSGFGWSEVNADNCDIGMCSSKKGPGTTTKEWIVARDAVSIIVNSAKAANLDFITDAELAEIYSDETGDGPETWGSLSGWTGGADADPIVPRARIVGSGTRQYFLEDCVEVEFVDEETVINATGLARFGANEDIPPAVGDNPTHLGYVGLGFIDDDPDAIAVPIKIGAGTPVMPSGATVENGTYPFSRSLYMYTLLPSVDPTYKLYVFDYLNWLLSPAGQAIVEDEGFVSVSAVAPYWDLNADGVCDLFDVLAVAGQWNWSGAPGGIPADLNADGTVDLFDVLIVAGHWNETWS
jgi:phosphate transport system substrate-binding protein